MAVKKSQQILRALAATLFLLVAFAVFGTDDLESLLGDEFEGEVGESVNTEQPADGLVDRVIDGDTVDVVMDGEVTRVRLIGIDTPETVDPRKDVECFGLEASQYLKDLIEGEVVSVAYDSSQGKADRYDRQLVYLLLADGTNVAENMLLDGYAYEYTYSKPYLHQEAFKNAEQTARANKSGLWSSTTCGGNR